MAARAIRKLEKENKVTVEISKTADHPARAASISIIAPDAIGNSFITALKALLYRNRWKYASFVIRVNTQGGINLELIVF